ncbi:MAG: hypothetical protein LBV18_01310 [Alistipes sp.]|jgi:hypothetical protein|nr:hypothetical protein [Alistipes sp.]
MKKLLQLASLCALALGLAVSCGDPDKEPTPPTPEAPAAPTGLTVGTLTTTTAALSWSAVEGADGYNVTIGDGEATSVTSPAYAAEGLTPETVYTWKVQAVKGDLASDWTDGTAFTTLKENEEPEPEPLKLFVDNNYEHNRGIYSDGADNLNIGFLDIDPWGTETSGTLIRLDMATAPINVDKTTEFLQIPNGTYELNTSTEAGSIFHNDTYSFVQIIEDAFPTAMFGLTGGTMTVEGSHPDDYTITVDFTYTNGEEDMRFYGIYEGPILMKNPDYVIPAIDFGTLVKSNGVNFYSNPYDDYSVDRWAIYASDPGVEKQGGNYLGEGYVIELSHIFTAIGSNKQIPDGEYTIDYSGDAGTVEGAKSDNASHSGAWIVKMENTYSQAPVALVQGKMTFAYVDGEYTIEVDAVSDKGTVVTGTVKIAHEADLGDGTVGGTPGDIDYDPDNDHINL